MFFLSVSLGCRHEIVIFIFLFFKRSKKIKNYKKKKKDFIVITLTIEYFISSFSTFDFFVCVCGIPVN